MVNYLLTGKTVLLFTGKYRAMSVKWFRGAESIVWGMVFMTWS